MRLSEIQMSMLRDAADGLHQRYPDVTFHPAQAEEFDARMTVSSVVEGQVGSYIHEPSPPTEPADRAVFDIAVEDAKSQWRIITNRTPASRYEQQVAEAGRTKIICTLSG